MVVGVILSSSSTDVSTKMSHPVTGFLTSVSTFLLFFVYFLSFIPITLSLFLLVVILYSTSLVFYTLEMNFVISHTLHVSIPLFVAIGQIMSGVHHNHCDAQNSIQQPVMACSMLPPFKLLIMPGIYSGSKG